jgi:NitT/TauT family transport system ATP-binding protein
MARDIPHISLRNVTVRYRSKTSNVLALDRVSLEIPPRSFVGIVGPSGCGKTTLLKVLSSVLRPSSGEILLDGSPLETRNLTGEFGYVFQRPLLLPWRSALNNVTLTAEVARKNLSREQRLAEARRWLEVMKLRGFEDKLPHQLSGGMQQRVSLARALVLQPRILMMDEPFAALDEITREALQDELLRLWELIDTTVLFITHSISEAVLLSQRVVVMTPRPGRIAEVIDVPFAYPRDENIRGSSRFAELVQSIRGRLRSPPLAEPEATVA